MPENNQVTGLTFLVIDDDDVVLQTVSALLKASGAKKVHTAPNGMAARDALAKKDPADTIDCILSDFNMEPMNGLVLLREIRACRVAGVRPDVCFILLTITGERVVVGGAKEMDVNGYMVKPVTRESLVAGIAKARSRYFKLRTPPEYDGILIPVS
ncbi:MAG: response regulator [Rhodospirillaceae bacterium]|nr:response regulator [Rhodospirillaceae bacterium]